MRTSVRHGFTLIELSIVLVIIGLVVGAILLIRRELYGIWPHPYLVSAHAHAVLVGFVIFLILGVALWLFPRAQNEWVLCGYPPHRLRVNRHTPDPVPTRSEPSRPMAMSAAPLAPSGVASDCQVRPSSVER